MSRWSMPTMGGEDFSEFSLPDHSIPAFDFHRRRRRSRQNRGESKKPERHVAELALEQIRARAGTDDSRPA